MSEHDEQVALFSWAEWAQNQMPALSGLFAIPNGGDRHVAVAQKMKAEGVKAGVLDVFLPVARGSYHGLFIEMKFGTNKPTEEQVSWLDFFSQGGYAVAVCYGFEAAKEVIEWYMRLDTTLSYGLYAPMPEAGRTKELHWIWDRYDLEPGDGPVLDEP